MLHNLRQYFATTKRVKRSYEISTKRYHLPVVFIVLQCFTRPVLPADYPESFHESTGVVIISLLLSALLHWGEATHVIIVFKRAEKREGKGQKETEKERVCR